MICTDCYSIRATRSQRCAARMRLSSTPVTYVFSVSGIRLRQLLIIL